MGFYYGEHLIMTSRLFFRHFLGDFIIPKKPGKDSVFLRRNSVNHVQKPDVHVYQGRSKHEH